MGRGPGSVYDNNFMLVWSLPPPCYENRYSDKYREDKLVTVTIMTGRELEKL